MIWGTRLSLFFRVQSYLLTEISSVVCNIDDSYYVCSIVTKQEKRKPGNEATTLLLRDQEKLMPKAFLIVYRVALLELEFKVLALTSASY